VPIALAGARPSGLLNGALIARGAIQPIVVTLATLIAGRGLAQVLSDDGQLVPDRDAAFSCSAAAAWGRCRSRC
jgi:ribose/xylose/arabinose/galactoside ABC-type transport system permease subunit